MKRQGIFPDFKFIPVVRKGRSNEIDEGEEDVIYWLSRPVKERIAAVTFLISQTLAEGERMDKTVITKKNLRHK